MGSSGGGTGASWTAASRPRKRGCPNRADQARRPRRGGSWSLARVLRGEHPGTRRPGGGDASRPDAVEPAPEAAAEPSDRRSRRRQPRPPAVAQAARESADQSRPADPPHATDQDRRHRLRYRRRWSVERPIGWLGTFRRLTGRYDRLLATCGSFFHFACALLVLRRVVK